MPPDTRNIRTIVVIDWTAEGTSLTSHSEHRSLGGVKLVTKEGPTDALAQYIERIAATERRWRGLPT